MLFNHQYLILGILRQAKNHLKSVKDQLQLTTAHLKQAKDYDTLNMGTSLFPTYALYPISVYSFVLLIQFVHLYRNHYRLFTKTETYNKA